MKKRNRAVALVAVLGTAGVLAGVAPGSTSSHREAPLIAEDPAADNTDVFAFVSPDRQDTVTLLAAWNPFEEPAGGPNFHKFADDARYSIHVDNTGDAVADITYEFRFRTQTANPGTWLYNTGPVESLDDADLNVRQTYSVTRVDKGNPTLMAADQPVVPANVGPRSTPDYPALVRQGVRPMPRDGGTLVWAGPSDDPFFVDLGSIFDLGGLRPFNQAHAIKQATAKGVDGLAGYNVHTIALQVPITRLTANGAGLSGPDDPRSVIGVWSTTERQSTKVLSAGAASSSGQWVQVSRLGMPLVNEVVVNLGLKDAFNALRPVQDATVLPAVLRVLAPETAQLINGLYGIPVPPAPRYDLITVFLTGIPGLNQPPNVRPAEMLRLNMAIPPGPNANRLGVIGGDNAGFPNGRRLIDDVTDVELRALAGGYPFTPDFNKEPNNALGDGVDVNDVQFQRSFPYVGIAHQGYSHPHGHEQQ